MYGIVLQPLIDELVVTRAAQEIYVVDAEFHVLLAGTSPADLTPAVEASVLPFDLDRPVRQLVSTFDFDRGGIARTSTGKKSLRVVRLSGPGGTFYGVLARARRRAAPVTRA